MEQYVSAQATTRGNKFSWKVFIPLSIRPLLWRYVRVRILLLVILSLLSGLFLWRWSWLNVAKWSLGLVAGWWIMEIDFFVKKLLMGKEGVNLSNDKKWDELWRSMIDASVNRLPMIVHSVIFQLIVGILCVYVVSSSGSFFPKGLAIAMSGRIVFEQVWDMLKSQSVSKWFWQIDMEISNQVQSLWILGWLLLWFALVWWMF